MGPLAWARALIGAPSALQNLQDDSRYTRPVVLGIPLTLARIERLIVTTAQDLAARLDAATNEIASDLQAARAAVVAAVADKDEAVRSAVAAALAPLDAGISRLEVLGQDPADPVPAPEEPTPSDPEVPAEPETPADEQL